LESAAKAIHRMTDEILTVPEVAALLKVADKTVYTMAQNAELPCFKVRGQWRFRRADIDQWIEAQTSGMPPANAKRRRRER
jgi:excisionase family DNA binding protein